MLRRSIWGASLVLVALNAALAATAWRRARTLTIEVVLRPQHYLQACAHLRILFYWGFYWHQVVEAAPLIAAQLLFAYAFDALLTWSRRDTYVLGFGPFPIIFSINLFLWFKADWFYLQFLHGGGRLRRQGIDHVDQGRPPASHLQPVVVHAGGVFASILLPTGIDRR